MRLTNIHSKGKIVYLFSRDDKGNQIIRKNSDFFPHYYAPDQKGSYIGYDGVPLKKIFVSEPKDVSKFRSEDSYSADILYVNNYLIHKVDKIEPCPIKYVFIDIEVLCKDFPHPEQAKYPISCITSYDSFTKKYNTWYLGECSNEETLLNEFVKYLQDIKPDIWFSWNVSFDYTYLHNRIKNFAKKISPINSVRMGEGKDIFYPAGISIVDYSGNKKSPGLFSKVFMREASYTLDYIGEKFLGKGKVYKDVDFSMLNENIKLRNYDDVSMMVELENRYKLIPYYDEIRRISKVKWEDLKWNSRIIESMLLEEAKLKNIILPNKKKDVKKLGFKGATREVTENGMFFDVGKVDLGSAYPSMIINFCLDESNINKKEGKEGTEINGVKFKQNSNALLPSMVKKILVLKNNLKKELKENPDLKNKYDAVKGIINSAFGVFGSPYFRLYNNDIVSSITFLVRDLLIYCKDRIEEDGYKVIFWDTDSLLYNSKEDLSAKLNKYIQDWGRKYGKNCIDLKFDYEGYFTKIIFLGMCHYYGYVEGKKEPEIKGVEVKRASSSKYEAYFQRELIEKVLNKESQSEIIKWIKNEKKRIKTLPLIDVAFPCKVQDKEYLYKPIFVRARENSKKLFGDKFDVRNVELFWYIFTKKLGYDNDGKIIDVIGLKKDSVFNKDDVNWKEIIRRNIINKAENIYDSLKWSTIDLHDENQLSLF